MKTLTITAFAGLMSACLVSPAPLHADAELELQPPAGANVLSWSPEQQLNGYGNMAGIFPTRRVPASDSVLPLPSAGLDDAFDELSLIHI